MIFLRVLCAGKGQNTELAEALRGLCVQVFGNTEDTENADLVAATRPRYVTLHNSAFIRENVDSNGRVVMTTIRNSVIVALFLAAQAIPCPAAPDGVASLIFPTPREITDAGGAFALDDQVTIAVPSTASQEDLLLARFLTDELGDRFAPASQNRTAGSTRGGEAGDPHGVDREPAGEGLLRAEPHRLERAEPWRRRICPPGFRQRWS